MALSIEPTGQTCGALVRGIDLSEPLSGDALAELRQAWLTHQVIGLPDQQLTPDTLTRFATRLGPNGDDPYLAGLPSNPRVVEVRREPDETTALFAESWHSDWSFLRTPPSATLLYGVEIPPVGGDTMFANLQAACEALSAAQREALSSLNAVHSARNGYSLSGRYSKDDQTRSMKIKSDNSALATRSHPLIRTHPETGKQVLFISPAYTIGIEGMSDEEGGELLRELFAFIERPEFVYQHKWAPKMLTIWDNRSLNHRATGGYEGHRRLLQRVTVGEPTAHA